MDDRQGPQHRDRDFDLGVKNVKVFTRHTEILGLPSNVFIVGGALCLGMSLLFFWWAGIIAAMLYFPFMGYYHRDDPRGAAAIQAALQEKYSVWDAGTVRPRRIEFID
ncbi:MAG: hypothetical protein HKM24_04490 [Gammaproteobacteria bacterium]|nr:hypothetical protein [Gammaproteobacteria bacterium]